MVESVTGRGINVCGEWRGGGGGGIQVRVSVRQIFCRANGGVSDDNNITATSTTKAPVLTIH